MRDFVVGVNYTYRKYTGALYPHRTGLTENDYEIGGYLTGRLYNGQEFNQPYYQLKPGVPIPAGVTLSNRPDWDTTYNGVDLTFQKRLTDKWLVRGGGTYQNWNQHGGAGPATTRRATAAATTSSGRALPSASRPARRARATTSRPCPRGPRAARATRSS